MKINIDHKPVEFKKTITIEGFEEIKIDEDALYPYAGLVPPLEDWEWDVRIDELAEDDDLI